MAFLDTKYAVADCAISSIVPNGSIAFATHAMNLNFNSQLVLKTEKFTKHRKKTNHSFTCYLNCMSESYPVCLIQQWSVIFLLASYVQ